MNLADEEPAPSGSSLPCGSQDGGAAEMLAVVMHDVDALSARPRSTTTSRC
jgi:hypothetical protein